jgi:hypothetical protein
MLGWREARSTMTEGLSLLELSDLPADWRTIIRMLMREQSLTYAALKDALATLPEPQQIEGARLNDLLSDLCRQGYLVQDMIDGQRAFRAQIARKSGRTLNKTLWGALEPSDSNEPPPKRAERPERPARKNLWDSLG